jgi:hypothetical protein
MANKPRPPTLRSAVTNGSKLLEGVDQRSPLARRYRDIAGAIIADLGGEDMCSEVKKQLIRRFAGDSVLAERMEAALVRGEQVNIAEYTALSSSLVRLANRIGVERVPKDIGPSLADIIASHAGRGC